MKDERRKENHIRMQKHTEKLRTIVSIAFISFSVFVSPLISFVHIPMPFNSNSRFVVDFPHANWQQPRKGEKK